MAAWLLRAWLGDFTLISSTGTLTDIRFGECPGNEPLERLPILKTAEEELNAYFAGRLQRFSVPIAPAGTPFQRMVWQLLRDIPYGHTASYSEIAIQAGNAKAFRAVGSANHRNPLPIVIPCHRVVGKSGALVGYAGGLAMKKALLSLEQGVLMKG